MESKESINFLLAVPSETQRIEQELNLAARLTQAVEHHRANRVLEATIAYQDVLQIAPRHAEVLHMLGMLAFGDNDYQRAANFLEQSLQINPDHPICWSNRGLVYLEQNKLPDAEAAFRRSISLNPDYVDAHIHLANLLKQEKNWKLAEASYRSALLLRPKLAIGWMNLGLVLRAQNLLDDAKNSLQHALELAPNEASIHNHLGVLFLTTKQYTRAEHHFRSVLALKPNFSDAHFHLGIALIEAGRLGEAEAYYRSAMALQPKYEQQWLKFKSERSAQLTIQQDILPPKNEPETLHKLKVLVVSDPPFRSSGYGNINLAQLPFMRRVFNMSFLAWGWNGKTPNNGDLSRDFPGIEFYPIKADYYGGEVLQDVIEKSKPDILLLHGDIFMFANTLRETLEKYRDNVCQIIYYPIDGENFPPKWVPFLQQRDGLIAYNNFAKRETEKATQATVRVTPLGVDPTLFFPISSDEKQRLRKQEFPWMDQRFVVTWIGRNMLRKNPGLAIMGFAQWVKKHKVDDALLYMHCADNDPAGCSIMELVRRDFPEIEKQIVMPSMFNIRTGVSRTILAKLIQCSDVGLNTSVGEGWGMPITETMACGVPVIVPAHTACLEQVGSQGERGELIKIGASIHVLNNILQHIGDPSSLAGKLQLLYQDDVQRHKVAKAGHEWASALTWAASAESLIGHMLDFHIAWQKSCTPVHID